MLTQSQIKVHLAKLEESRARLEQRINAAVNALPFKTAALQAAIDEIEELRGLRQNVIYARDRLSHMNNSQTLMSLGWVPEGVLCG